MASVYGYVPTPSTVSVKAYGAAMPMFKPALSGDIDLSQYCVAMDQYELSSCVGNGTCEALEMLESMAHEGIQGYSPVLLSRLFIYNAAREKEGILDQDAGTTISTAFDVLATLGVCRETLWPYQSSLVFRSPSILSQREAVGHKIHSAYKITSSGQSRIDDIISALSSRHPVVFGTQVTKAFEQLSGLGPMTAPGPKDVIVGGHCMVIVGYLGGNFLIKNSWGTSWGQGGLCMFTPDYLADSVTQDIWVPTLGPVF